MRPRPQILRPQKISTAHLYLIKMFVGDSCFTQTPVTPIAIHILDNFGVLNGK
jgi:hypothetical protein